MAEQEVKILSKLKPGELIELEEGPYDYLSGWVMIVDVDKNLKVALDVDEEPFPYINFSCLFKEKLLECRFHISDKPFMQEFTTSVQVGLLRRELASVTTKL